MKRIFFVAHLVLLCLFFSCKKAAGPADGNSIKQNNNLDSTVSVSADVNGVTWQTDSAIGYNIQYSGNDSGVVNLMITATNEKVKSSLSTITFNITNYTGPNTYPVNPPLNAATYYKGNLRYIATKGNIVIASDTAYALKGTFNFTADTIVVTNGVFNVALP